MPHYDQKPRNPTARLADKALEMVMRDVLGGMSELATVAGYSPRPCEFEILQPRPAAPHGATAQSAHIIPYPGTARERPADMVDYLTRRELAARA